LPCNRFPQKYGLTLSGGWTGCECRHPNVPTTANGCAFTLIFDSPKTLEAYRFWIVRFQSFVRSRPTADLGAQEVRGFLSDLAVREPVSAPTQNQAFGVVKG